MATSVYRETADLCHSPAGRSSAGRYLRGLWPRPAAVSGDAPSRETCLVQAAGTWQTGRQTGGGQPEDWTLLQERQRCLRRHLMWWRNVPPYSSSFRQSGGEGFLDQVLGRTTSGTRTKAKKWARCHVALIRMIMHHRNQRCRYYGQLLPWKRLLHLAVSMETKVENQGQQGFETKTCACDWRSKLQPLTLFKLL